MKTRKKIGDRRGGRGKDTLRQIWHFFPLQKPPFYSSFEIGVFFQNISDHLSWIVEFQLDEFCVKQNRSCVSTCKISGTDSPQTASWRPHFWVFVVELWPFWDSYLTPWYWLDRWAYLQNPREAYSTIYTTIESQRDESHLWAMSLKCSPRYTPQSLSFKSTFLTHLRFHPLQIVDHILTSGLGCPVPGAVSW